MTSIAVPPSPLGPRAHSGGDDPQAAEAQAWLAAIVESSPEAIVGVGLDDRVVSWNAGAERLYGRAPAEVVGRPLAILAHPGQPDGVPAMLARVARGERVEGHETEHLAGDGRRLSVALTVFPVAGPAGVVVGAAIIARDVTEQRRAEARLQDVERRYRALVEQIPAATYVEAVDPDESSWVTEYISPQIEEILGYPAATWTGDPGFGPTLLHPDDRARVLALDAATDTTGGRFAVEYRMTARDGRTIWIRDEAVLVRDEAGEPAYWLGFMLDVTAQKEAEGQRAALLAALQEHAHRVEELARLKDDFSSIVAHELVTPVAAIRWFVEALQLGGLEPDEVKDALSTIKAETDLLHLLIDDVRAIAKVDRDDYAVEPVPTPVGDLLASAAAYARLLPGGHPFRTEAGAGGVVLADRARIGQVLRNLLGNAAKYTPPGTPVVLRAAEAAGGVRIEVEDAGPGIHPDDAEAVFEKYRRGRQPDGRLVAGAGVGLYVSRRIARAHGSDLVHRSAPGGGATFGFELRRPD